MTEIVDIYNGKSVMIWEDEEFTFLNIWNVTMSFPNEEWNKIKEELKEIGDL